MVRIGTIHAALIHSTVSTSRICRLAIKGSCRHSITIAIATLIVRNAGTTVADPESITRRAGSMSGDQGAIVAITARGRGVIIGHHSGVISIRNAVIDAPEVQRFFHCGSRFSKKALTPSRVS